MSEADPRPQEAKGNKQQELQRYIALGEELSRNPDGFPFSGINEESRIALEAVDEEYSGFATPVGELVARMEKEGIKIAFGEDKESGNVFVLPLQSNDIDMDSLFPRHLKIDPDIEIDESLKELILINKARFERESKNS